jgi:hypothetical protein
LSLSLYPDDDPLLRPLPLDCQSLPEDEERELLPLEPTLPEVLPELLPLLLPLRRLGSCDMSSLRPILLPNSAELPLFSLLIRSEVLRFTLPADVGVVLRLSLSLSLFSIQAPFVTVICSARGGPVWRVATARRARRF